MLITFLAVVAASGFADGFASAVDLADKAGFAFPAEAGVDFGAVIAVGVGAVALATLVFRGRGGIVLVTNWTGILIFTGSAAGGGSVADDALAVVIKKASLALKADPAWLVTFLALLAAFGLGNGVTFAIDSANVSG